MRLWAAQLRPMANLANRTRSGRSSKWIWRSTRLAIYHRDKWDCVYCRGVFPPATGYGDLTLDHVKPRSQGGSSRPDNLVTCCYECNASRQDRPLTRLELRRAQRACARPLDRTAARLAQLRLPL